MSSGDALPRKFPSPPYAAASVDAPTSDANKENSALPEPFSGTVTGGEAPDVNAIVPVGEPIPGAITDTFACKVSVLCSTIGFAEDTMAVAVDAGATVSSTVAAP